MNLHRNHGGTVITLMILFTSLFLEGSTKEDLPKKVTPRNTSEGTRKITVGFPSKKSSSASGVIIPLENMMKMIFLDKGIHTFPLFTSEFKIQLCHSLVMRPGASVTSLIK